MTDDDDKPEGADEIDLMGPAMTVLTEKQRRFVWAMHRDPLGSQQSWAKAAGYSDKSEGGIRVRAHETLASAKVQDAILEVSRATLGAAGIVAATTALIEIAKNPRHPGRLKAAELILNRTGLSEKQQIEVVHTYLSGDALLARVQYLASKHGVDISGIPGLENGPTRLFGGEPKAIEHQAAPASNGQVKDDGEAP